jgi:hypothetical protein
MICSTKSLYALLSFVLMFSLPAFGRNAQLSGLIRDSSHAAVRDAAIQVENTSTHVKWSATSNGNGLYFAPSLSPGVYRITVQSPGFEQQVVEDLKLEVEAKVSFDITLKVGSEKQSVTVDASGIQINTTDAAVSTVLDQKFVENMPLNGRSFQSLLTAVPGVSVVPSSNGQGYSGELTVNGMRTESNYYLVDGVSMNTGAAASTPGWGGGYSGATPAQTVLGTTQSLISIEALKELRATTSTYSAEYGRTPGGQFSFSSRSGTNNFHGSIYEYFRNDVLDSNDWFSRRAGIRKPRTRQNDFGGTFGGPIIVPGLYNGRNRSFFFASYEGLRLTAPQSAVTTVVPGPTMRATAPVALRTFLNAFPISTSPENSTTGFAPYIAGYSNPSSLNALSVRADHSLSDRLKFFARYSWSPSTSQSRAASDLANVTQSVGKLHSGTAGLTWIITPRLANDLRFNSTYSFQSRTPTIDTFGGATPLSTAGIPGYSGNNLDWFDFYLYYGLRASFTYGLKTTSQNQINIVDTMTMALGRHSLKWGVDYRRLHSERPNPPLYSFPLFYSRSEVFANAAANSTLEKFSGSISPVYMNFSAFLQDEWKVNSRLSLSAGLRWDINPAPKDATGNNPYVTTQITDLATTKLAPRGTALWKTQYGNVSPRVGFAYQLHQQSGHETVLRAGFGTYYDMGSTAGSMGYFGVGIASAQRSAGTAFPFSQTAVDSLKVSATAPYNFSVYTSNPNLKSPYAWQWNASLEQGLGEHQTLTISYVASAGKNLLWTRNVSPQLLGNTDFSNSWGLYVTDNASSSNYNGLQVRYQQTLRRGLQVLGSYTWSHAIDDNTTNFTLNYLQRANSSYDIRHNGQVSLTYSVPSIGNGFAKALTQNWGVDSRVSMRSALPLDIFTATSVYANGTSVSLHPNRVESQPLYVYDSALPGGRKVNFAAFTPALSGTTPVEGNIGRNYARAFNALQADVAVRRDFHIYESLGVQFRMEAFNVLNHPIFGSVYSNMSFGAAAFGQAFNLQSGQLGGLNALYQAGGPRSMQASVKLRF